MHVTPTLHSSERWRAKDAAPTNLGLDVVQETRLETSGRGSYHVGKGSPSGKDPAQTRRNGTGSLDFTLSYTMNGGAGQVVLVKLKRETIGKMWSAIL